jgi:hypothetical protein
MKPITNLFVSRKLAGSICVIVFGAGVCMAQSTNPPATVAPDKDFPGVQLTTSLTNSAETNIVVQSGETITLRATIKNSTTNAIYLPSGSWGTDPADFDVRLAGPSGEIYHPIQHPVFAFYTNYPVTINSGEQYVKLIPVKFVRDIKAGGYALQVVRLSARTGGISALRRDEEYMLESNVLRVRVK